MFRAQSRCVAVVVVFAWAVGCGPSGPLRVTTIQLGRSLNPDNSVASHATAFKPTDTVYVSVLTAESGSATFRARWTYAGSLVDEPTKTV